MDDKRRVPILQAIVCLLFLLAGVIIGALGTMHLHDGMTQSDVIAFCDRLDRSESWELDEIQGTEYFLHIAQNLDAYLCMRDELIEGEKMCLSTLLWRAALFVGNDKQLTEAFNIAVIAGDTGPVVADVAGRFLRNTSPGNVFNNVATESLISFLDVLADNDPAAWGHYDFTRLLLHLMRKGETEDVRLRSAYCLARWRGGSEAAEEAIAALRDASEQGKWLGQVLYQSLQALGTQGWKRPPVQRTQTVTTPATRHY